MPARFVAGTTLCTFAVFLTWVTLVEVLLGSLTRLHVFICLGGVTNGRAWEVLLMVVAARDVDPK